MGDRQVLLPGRDQGAGDRFAETAFRVMVFGDHEAPAGGLRRRREGGGVDRLDRITVDDPDVDALRGQLIGGAQALVQRDAGADQGNRVPLAGAEHLGAAHGEGFP